MRAIPPRPEFSITEPGQVLSPRIARAGARDGSEAASFRQAVLDLHARLEIPAPPAADRPGVDLAATGVTLLAALDPVRTIPKRILSFVAVPPGFGSVRPVDTLAPVMAHPVFADPMYKPLRDISTELLVPNLGLVPNNTITLMETNNRFVEAYLVGLNHEMASELLWREYPTDQRGSYFRQFWDVGDVVARDDGTDASAREEALRDITPLHTWGRTTALGSHDNRALPTGSEPGDARLVLVIRGDLLKRYPDCRRLRPKGEMGGRSGGLRDAAATHPGAGRGRPRREHQGAALQGGDRPRHAVRRLRPHRSGGQGRPDATAGKRSRQSRLVLHHPGTAG